MKRFLAVLLLVVTMLGTFSMPAAAYTYPMEYTITYKSTDGTVLGTKKGSVDAAADVRNALSIPSPSYTGYSLQNAKDATVTGSMITWNFPASNYIRHGTGGYTVYYVKNIQVTIYYIYGGSKRVAAPPKTITGAPSATYSITSPTVTGYTPDKKTVYDAYKNGNKYVYYYENVYTISFNANGGSGAPASITKSHFLDSSVKLPTTKPTRTGYNFLGWSTSSTATSATYSAGGSYSSNGNVTLYAVWAKKTYTISYNANGGSGAPSSQTKTHDTDIRISGTKPTRKGYDFLGWGLSSTTSTVSYSAGDRYATNASRTLYAVWSAKKYTVSYNANGGNGAPSSQTKTYNVGLTLSSTVPTRNGYTFKGWATSSTATSATYSAGATYSTNASATLYAVWSCNHSSTTKKWIDGCNWKIVCDTCGVTIRTGTTHGPYSYSAWTYYSTTQHKRTKSCDHGDYSETEYGSHSTSTKYEQYSSTQHKKYAYCTICNSKVGTVSNENHSYTTSTINGQVVSVCSKCGYTTSKAATYTVSYNANGGSGAPSAQTKTHGVALTLSGTKPTRTGYDFLGWATSSTATTAAYSAGGSFSGNTDTTLYAVWRKTTYSIKFDANGGSGAPASQTKTYGVTLTLPSVKPTRFNYDFIGWSTSQAATSATYTAGGSYTANSGATLYAVWKYNPAKYTVSYNANGGSGAPSSQTKTYGVALTLSSIKPTRFNYDFKGWATSSTATSAAYNAGDAYTVNEGTTLYAVWAYNPAKYTVTFNANGGSNPPASQTKVYGEALTITTAVPEREGYNCVGWATSSTATTAEYAPGASYTINSATTLYAVWKLKTYTIMFNANGGSGAPSPVTKTHGQAVSLVATTPSRSGYKFLGWSTDKNVEQPEYKSTDKYSDNGDVTLYAIWASSNYEFRVGNLTVDKTEVNQYAKITVKFNAYCDDNKLFFYSVPVEVLCDGKPVMTKTVEISGGSQLVIGFDMTVGEVIGNHTLEARINWNERSKETNPNNNTATCSFKVNQLIETSTSAIKANGEYYTGSEVISSFYISNGSSYDILPSNAVNYDFKVYYFDNGAEKVVNTQTWKNVVIPANGTNLVYFKWTVPSDNAGITYYVRGSINAAKATTEADSTNNTVEFTIVSKEKISSQTPNTRYEKNAPTSYNVNASAQGVTAGSATWNMWVYENNALVLKSYGITVTSENPTVAPSSECSTASKIGTIWNMKSGYGISVSWNPKLVSISGTVMPGSDAYTNPQNVVAAFPEYNYSFETGKCRTLENVSGTYMFVQNADADGKERIHFIPVYVKNGNYNVSVTASGIWTPAGMITAVRNANAININGTIYDDWYSGV